MNKITNFCSLIIDLYFTYMYNILWNKEKQGCVASKEEVMCMVEALLQLIILLFAGLVSVTIIAFALIIALVVIISKQI